MIQVIAKENEYYDSKTESFISVPETELKLEHSLRAISKWEAFYKRPFLGNETKSAEEIYYYIICMVTNLDYVDPMIINNITSSDINHISNYIQTQATATTINNTNGSKNKEIVTSELIYYWMIALNIPFECQDWHLSRLLMLVNVCNLKNAPAKKQSPKETLSKNKALNDARKKAMKTSG